jgi:hypothetical protein
MAMVEKFVEEIVELMSSITGSSIHISRSIFSRNPRPWL